MLLGSSTAVVKIAWLDRYLVPILGDYILNDWINVYNTLNLVSVTD